MRNGIIRKKMQKTVLKQGVQITAIHSIKCKNTGLKKNAVRMLRRAKIKHRSHPQMFGSQNFLVEDRLVLFCDSSFWHRICWFKLKWGLQADNNPSYGVKHIKSNKKRNRCYRTLRKHGHVVPRLWGVDVRKPKWCVGKIRKALE